jgi:hypothetical protein
MKRSLLNLAIARMAIQVSHLNRRLSVFFQNNPIVNILKNLFSFVQKETMHFKPVFILLVCFFLISKALYAQDNQFWKEVSESSISVKGVRQIIPQQYHTLSLSIDELKTFLVNVPSNRNGSTRNIGKIISLPLPDGSFARFRFIESSVMAPELAAKYPQIKTYAGQGVDDRGLSVRFDFTPAGFHAIIHSPETGLSFIDPYSQGDIIHYIVYAKKDYKGGGLKKFTEDGVLGTDPERLKKLASDVAKYRAQKSAGTQRPSGDELRTYRVAIAATGEYTAFHGGTVNAALGGIVTTLNRVNFIYIREVDVQMTLIANDDAIIYTNSSTDPYTNGNPGAMIGQNQSNIDNVIGSANYDIGHVFGTNSGGLAGLGVVCVGGNKASGVTGSANPIGDPFDVDYVAHEMGHQFGANHSFNGDEGSCAGNRNPGTAFEPGSGSTIMAYAGICGSEDLQPNSDAYFHTESYEEIFSYTEFGSGSSCAVITHPVNAAPSPAIVTPSGLTIPISTPFTITGSATDPNSDPITYNWEEYDLGNAGHPDFPVGNAPTFRSFTATSSPSRTFPKLTDIVNNTHTIGELLPSYTRSLTFNLTVRDNWFEGGGVDWAFPLSINVTSGAGPFRVTSPNTSITWMVGTTQTVTWNVASTNLSPVGVSSVKISLSTDGGFTYPVVLLASTPNDGSQSIVVPNIVTSSARIKVEAIGNIFFDISNANFSIISPSPTVLWNKRFGGTADDRLYSMLRLSDGSYLLGGSSLSGIAGDKSQASRGGRDYWVVKINSSGTKVWDKRFGGTANDNLNAIIATSDGNFLLGGSSISGAGGDKTEASRGGYDYWVVKINSSGTKLWDKRFGGSGTENLQSLIQTSDGGFILAGYSTSGTGGDKTETSRGGNDYWAVKINSSGTKLWDKRFGGSLDEILTTIITTSDGNFLLGGNSTSGAGGDKTEASRGSNDYWVVKINGSGTRLWDRRFGGSSNDLAGNVVRASDGGFLISGYSFSGVSGDKTQSSRGGSDYWVVKTNSSGSKLWDRRFGGTANDTASALISTSDGGFVLGGWTSSGVGGDKTEASRGGLDYWIVKVNSSGSKLWDKRFGGTSTDVMAIRTLIQNPDNTYLVGGSSLSGVGGDKTEASRGGFDYWVLKTTAGASREALVTKADVKMENVQSDAELADKGNAGRLNVYPNPFSGRFTVQINLSKGEAAQSRLDLYSMDGKLIKNIYSGNSNTQSYRQFDFNGKSLKNGVYILKLTTPSGIITKKIIRIE